MKILTKRCYFLNTMVKRDAGSAAYCGQERMVAIICTFDLNTEMRANAGRKGQSSLLLARRQGQEQAYCWLLGAYTVTDASGGRKSAGLNAIRI